MICGPAFFEEKNEKISVYNSQLLIISVRESAANDLWSDGHLFVGFTLM